MLHPRGQHVPTDAVVLLVLACSIFCLTFGQNVRHPLSDAGNQFATRLIHVTERNLGDANNIALSPFTIRTLLTIIAEGAHGKTLHELQTTLGLPGDMTRFRSDFHTLAMNLLRNENGVSVDMTNAIFVTTEFPLNATFKKVARQSYNVDVQTTNFKDNAASLTAINNYISEATQRKFNDLVNPDDIQNADIFMTCILSFKGKWRYTFNTTRTKTGETFFADDGTTPIGTVDLMYQSAPFPFTAIPELKSFVAELPYGDGTLYSMIVILPSRSETLSNVLKKLSNTQFSSILQKLSDTAREYPDEEIDVYLPRFTVTSEFTMNRVLNQMGVNDVFNSDAAELPGIFPHFLYLNRLLQKAVIDVDEDGTVATAVAGGSFAYKTSKPTFKANKPFAFFITDKQTGNVIFEGKVSNPKGICATCTGF